MLEPSDPFKSMCRSGRIPTHLSADPHENELPYGGISTIRRSELKNIRPLADASGQMPLRTILKLARRRAGAEHAQSLVEALVAMAVLGIILAPISAAFTSSLRHESIQSRREQAQGGARTALQRMRLDIHCAHATTLPVQQNSYGGYTLTLPENPGQCPGVVPSASGVSGVSGARFRIRAARHGFASTDSMPPLWHRATRPRSPRSSPTTSRRRQQAGPPMRRRHPRLRTGPGTSGPPPTRVRRQPPHDRNRSSTSRSTLSTTQLMATSFRDRIASLNADPC